MELNLTRYMDAKQTAVEWLFAHLIPHLDWSKTEDRNEFRQLEQEALAMEKEQMEKLKDFDTWKAWKNNTTTKHISNENN
jgi:hypothetical protein